MSRKKRFSKHYQAQATPDQLGLLMELHRQAKELSVVIQFLCTSTTGNQSVTYQDNAYTQADVLNLYQDLGSVHIPAHRDRPFRLNVTACSGLS
ncbi:hypothetical protein [Halopseudomonas sp.]|uniref:hypothetical protein n=1 Tax=Halopseudomonas sp. TaxID=2901191 RepID=UPI0030033B32